MKDFDAERQYRSEAERDFKIGGEHFRARARVRPEVLVPFEEMTNDPDSTGADALRVIDDMILGMIEPTDDAQARYRALREREDDPVDLDDLQELAKWLHETTTGRPTEPSGDSSTGPDETGTSSTDTSSSPDIPAE